MGSVEHSRSRTWNVTMYTVAKQSHKQKSHPYNTARFWAEEQRTTTAQSRKSHGEVFTYLYCSWPALTTTCIMSRALAVLAVRQQTICSSPAPSSSCSERDVCLLVACLTPEQHASVSQGQICPDKFTCCYSKTGVADQTWYLTQSVYWHQISQSRHWPCKARHLAR